MTEIEEMSRLIIFLGILLILLSIMLIAIFA